MSLEGPWAPADTGPRFRVVLLKFTGETRHSWEASLEALDNEKVILRATANRQLSFEETVIRPGDLAVQYFPRNESYSIQEYQTPSGQLKGWYCNIAEPPKVEDSTITTRDLIVDIFVWPDGRYKVLDMDEFEMHRGAFDIDLVEKIFSAKKKLIGMIEKGEYPFQLR